MIFKGVFTDDLRLLLVRVFGDFAGTRTFEQLQNGEVSLEQVRRDVFNACQQRGIKLTPSEQTLMGQSQMSNFFTALPTPDSSKSYTGNHWFGNAGVANRESEKKAIKKEALTPQKLSKKAAILNKTISPEQRRLGIAIFGERFDEMVENGRMMNVNY